MKDRNMFYSNYQSGGFMDPNFNQPMMGVPAGYNINQNYQAYGPNVMPNNIGDNSMVNNNTYVDEYDNRITKLERQIRRIDQRLRKLENSSQIADEEISIDNNLYMI